MVFRSAAQMTTIRMFIHREKGAGRVGGARVESGFQTRMVGKMTTLATVMATVACSMVTNRLLRGTSGSNVRSGVSVNLDTSVVQDVASKDERCI